jgi:SSS family solute:Na+ symporter
MSMLAAGILRGPDYFILVGYFILMLGIGAYFYRFMQGMKDYFSGGNRIPWWLSGVSFWMSSFSVFAFVFYSGLAYKYGWVAVTIYWVTVPATLVSVLFFSVRWRRARIDSPVEYLETRYGSAMRQLVAWQGVPVKIVDDGLKLVAIGTFISVGLGLDLKQSMVGCALIMMAYTFMGGLWAVAVTDFIQFVVLAAAIIIVLPLSIAEVGGVANLVENAPEGFFRLTVDKYDWVYVGTLVVLFSLSWSSIQWALIQRYYCVPTETDALKVGWLVVALNIIGPPLMYLPAMAARQFLPELADEAHVYPLLCAKLLPAGMLGLVIAAMFSATMSMLSSDYNVCASVLTNDIYRRLLRPHASDRELVLVGRLMTLLIGLLALGIALFLLGRSGEKMFRTMVTLFSVASAPVGIPMVAGLLSRKATNAGALTGLVCGLVLGLILLVRLEDETHLFGAVWQKENLLFISTSLVTLITMILVSALKPTGQQERDRVESFHERLAKPVGELEQDNVIQSPKGSAVLSPFRVVGISIVFIALMMIAVLPWVEGNLAKGLDALLGGLLLLIGAVMTWRSGQAGC